MDFLPFSQRSSTDAYSAGARATLPVPLAHRPLILSIALGLLLAAAALLPAAPAAARAGVCDRVAGPGQGPKSFVRSLRAGETGCLRDGTYRAPAEGIKFARPGVTLRSRPGSRATVIGRLWIAAGADRVTIRGLRLDGRNPKDQASPVVNANGATFRNNDVTNHHTGICFLIGHQRFGRASGTVIRDNRIHHCGRLPATNHEHGIYVAYATGTRIVGNRIYRNADRGIQLYPDADRTLVSGNVIARNGQGLIFSGGSDDVSEHNVVKRNVIKKSNVRFNVEWNWRGRVGEGNVLRRNCIFGGARDEGNGGIREPFLGFVARRNTTRKQRCG